MNYNGDAAVMLLKPTTIQVQGTKMQKNPPKTWIILLCDNL